MLFKHKVTTVAAVLTATGSNVASASSWSEAGPQNSVVAGAGAATVMAGAGVAAVMAGAGTAAVMTGAETVAVMAGAGTAAVVAGTEFVSALAAVALDIVNNHQVLFASGIVASILPTVDASGYNETNKLGVEAAGTFQQITGSSGIARLLGVTFSQVPGLSLNAFINTMNCALSDGSQATGLICITRILQSAVYLAHANVNPTNADSDNLVNTVVIRTGLCARRYYASGNRGQGGSCSPDTWDPSRNCIDDTSVDYLRPTTSDADPCFENRDITTFPAPSGQQQRALKVTCKSACSGRNGLTRNTSDNIVDQIIGQMRAQSAFSARFTIGRELSDGTNFAVARCRITIPNLVQFGMDRCPDAIPGSGNGLTLRDGRQ